MSESHVLYRQLRHDYPVAVGGEGPYIVDRDGKRYLDASGGAAVSCLGHSHKAVVEAIKAQLDRIPYVHSAFFTTEASEELADFLTARAPGDLSRVSYVSGGSEANESALKLVRQYFVETGQPQRHRIIARRQSYHGNTLGALAAGGHPARRAPFEPLLIETSHIAPCYAYRLQEPGESAADYGRRAADELETEILRLGPETVAAFMVEPVAGASIGAAPPAPGYLRRIREICDRHGVMLIFDEVMCGMGRTGTLFACEQEGVAPDLLTCAKGLGAGYQPIGAVLAAEKIHDALARGSGAQQGSFTYVGHPAACAGALAVQRAIEDENLLDNVQRQGANLRAALEARFGNHHSVGDIRGRGLFLALELVQDRGTKAPIEGPPGLPNRIRDAAMAEGLICYPGGGTADGWRGAHVLLAPSYIIGESHVGEIVDKLDAALGAALAETATQDQA